jgi:outer membrane murein-binding lipoprotein Lpp
MRILVAIVSLTLLTGCMDHKKKEIDQLGEEVIKLHDEVMPLMDGLYQTRMKLQKQLASQTTSEDSLTIVTTLSTIKAAEDHMMNWMRNFNPTYEGANPDETIQYLLDQKNSIKAVSKQMKNAKNVGLHLLSDN